MNLLFLYILLHSFRTAHGTQPHTWTHWTQRKKIYPNKQKRRSEWSGHGCWQYCDSHPVCRHQPPLYVSLSFSSPSVRAYHGRCFSFFPWNPFHIIKDTQMKWTLRKSGFQQGGGCGGGGGWEAESWEWGIGCSRSAPPSRQWGPTLKGGRLALAPVWINIISVINIKSTLLCFASGTGPRQLEGPVLTDSRFLPSSPPHPSLAIYRDHNLLWWVFRVLFCQGQSGLSNKWSQWSEGGLAPANPLPRFTSDTCGQIRFWKFHVNCFRPWLREEQRKKEGWRKNWRGGVGSWGQAGAMVKLGRACHSVSHQRIK